jgi:hydroxyacylglutathione hydrolase
MLEIIHFTLGPVQTNAYLIADVVTQQAAVIDPAWDGEVILEEARRRGLRIAHLWFTHAHFDHIGGAAAIANELNPTPFIALHPADHQLWRFEGGAPLFGFKIDPGPEPSVDLFHGQHLQLGAINLEVRATPGHTPGHCIFYASEDQVCFCGDLIFRDSIGRTDLPGGNTELILRSIREQVLTLPDETRLLCGHGEVTTVEHERNFNPFLQQDKQF